MTNTGAIHDHFVGKDPIVRTIYARILSESRRFGPVVEEPKKTSIHLVNKSAFAGVTTRSDALILNIKSAAPIKDPRFKKSERVSASRYHQELRLTSPDQIDARVRGWLKDAYALSG